MDGTFYDSTVVTYVAGIICPAQPRKHLLNKFHLNKMGKILYCSPMEKHLRTSYMLAMAGYNIYSCMLAWRSNVICLLKKISAKKNPEADSCGSGKD